MIIVHRRKAIAIGCDLIIVLVIFIMAGRTLSPATHPSEPQGQGSEGRTSLWETVDPQYLIFWAEVQKALEVKTQAGTAGDGKSRVLGFGVVNSPFDMTDDDIRERIRHGFETARQNQIAVFFCYDFHHFWEKRPELWNWFDPSRPGYNPANRNNVEWIDWQGTPNKARYLDWGAPQKLSPQMCYNCPVVRQEITRMVTQVIGPALNSEIASLVRSGQAYLFAGVLVGGEPQLDDYAAVATLNPKFGKFIAQDGGAEIRLGYHALINKGYSAERPPSDFKAAVGEVNREFVAFCAQQFAEAQISPSRLYNHVAAPGPKFVAAMNAPLWIAFNAYSRPGWTTYPVADLAADFQPIYNLLREHHDPPWGGVEANLGAAPSAPTSWEGYLERHFGHGAKLVGINVGASGEDLPARLNRSAFGPEAMAAYKKFLLGEELKADPHPAAPPAGN